MSKKLIGIPGFKSEGGFFGSGVHHLHFIAQFGEPIIIMPHEDYHEGLDMLYLPGGLDLSPSLYGETPSFHTTNGDVFKEHFYRTKLRNYVGQIPIFGVCLGFQELNVFFGGTLTQHLLGHPSSKERWEKGHDVIPLVGGGKKFEVNSHHHQGVSLNQLAHELKPLAVYGNLKDSDDCIVEAFQHRDLPIAGVQWHPEEFYDRFSSDLITEILG